MTSLYELSKTYQDIANQELEAEQIIEALNAVGEMFEEKAENIAKLMSTLESDCVIIKAEEQRLADRRKVLENKKENLKTYLQDQMIAIGKEKFKTSLFSFGIQNNPPSVNIIEESRIPAGYWIEQSPKLDKKLLLDDLKKGQLVMPDVVEIKQTKGLRIR